MAVPQGLALPNFKGTFTPQGVPYALRKVIRLAKIKITFTIEPTDPEKTDAPYRFLLQSSIQGLGFVGAAPLRAVGFPTENTDERIMDGGEQDKDEPVIGKTRSRIWMCMLADVLHNGESEASHGTIPVDDFLKQGWNSEEADKTHVVRLSIWSVQPGQSELWRNEQIWGVQDGRWTARIAFTKGATRETAKLLYDYISYP